MIYLATMLLGVGVSIVAAADTGPYWARVLASSIGTGMMWAALALVVREARRK